MMQIAKNMLRNTSRARIAWIFCAQFFVAEQVARLAWRVPYSFARNYISDLGATVCTPVLCSPWHALMNTSFVLQGMLIAGGAVLLWKVWHAVGRAALALLILCGAGVTLVGFVPENSYAGLHALGAVMHFLAGGFGLMLTGFHLRRTLGWTTIVVGLAVVAATVFLGQRGNVTLQALGVGAVERVAAYGIAGWLAVLGVCLRTTSRTSG